jgi:cobalt-zinc-cadmium efflux system protein
MPHHHNHLHGHKPGNYGFAFGVGIILNLVFVGTEVVYGILGNSLALVSDAGHNLSDVLGLAITWVAVWLGKKSPTKEKTYGYKRSSILSALFNAVFLLIALGAIVWEAIQRLISPEPVEGKTVIIVAIAGIIINAVTALLFMSGRKKDLNIGGAFLHMASDALQAFGVVVAGFVILWTGWRWLDSVVSLILAVVILLGTWRLLKSSVNLSLDAVPEGVDITKIESYLKSLPSIEEIHDLHVWGMSTTETALTVHLIRRDREDNDEMLRKITKELHDQFDIEHPTIQIENGTFCCSLKPEDKV